MLSQFIFFYVHAPINFINFSNPCMVLYLCCIYFAQKSLYMWHQPSYLTTPSPFIHLEMAALREEMAALQARTKAQDAELAHLRAHCTTCRVYLAAEFGPQNAATVTPAATAAGAAPTAPASAAASAGAATATATAAQLQPE